MNATTQSIALPPVRGLIPLHDHRGRGFRLADAHRAMRFSSLRFCVRKLDFLAWGAPPDWFPEALAYARELQVPASLRTDAAAPPPEALGAWAEAGMLDVFLCPRDLDAPHFGDWLDACAAAGLPVRLQVQSPFGTLPEPEAAAEQWRAKGVKVFQAIPEDPFLPGEPIADSARVQQCIDWLDAIVKSLSARDVECALIGFAPGVLPPTSSGFILSRNDYFRDHQQYLDASYAFARILFRRGPRTVRRILLTQMNEIAGYGATADRWINLALVKAPDAFRWPYLFVNKLWRGFVGQVGLESQGKSGEFRGAAPWPEDDVALTRRMFPNVQAQTGEAPRSGAARPRYLDRIDRERRDAEALRATLWERARRWAAEGPPSRTIEAADWGGEHVVVQPMHGMNVFLSTRRGEALSTKLPWIETPFMVTAGFGGGMAEHIGFGVGRFIRLLCPMIGPAHRLTLFADEEGRYILLRDGAPVVPVPVAGRHLAPPRLPNAMHLQLSAWNVDDSIAVSSIEVYDGAPAEGRPKQDIAVSVVLVCTRFSRRLAAVLACLAHQRGVPLDAIEVVVAYAPGLDATEDVLHSVRAAHPDLRVTHATFPAHNAKAKGFMINEAVRLASGARVVLLDADILLPPDLLAAAAAESAGDAMIAPRGRAMLDAETTARVLLGETRPWEDWDALLAGAAERREQEVPENAPVGYCQIVTREGFLAAPYPEYEHFKHADYEFAMAYRRKFGMERRLPHWVLHLDHGGRQWFGAQKHY